MAQPEQHNYDSLLDALNGLQHRGYTEDFNLEKDYLYCPKLNLKLHPDQFHVVEFYRFEGASNPSDSSIVYAIESDTPEKVKGTLVNAYGAYGDTASNALVAKLRIER